MSRTYTVNSEEYAALLNTKHWNTLRKLSIKDGQIYYNTGAFLQPVDERITMFEESHDRPEYKTELALIEDEDKRQQEYLRTI